MARTKLAALTAAALVLAPAAYQSAAARIQSEERVTYYDVNGESIETIMTALDTFGPPDDSGERFHGRTDARVDWSFNLRNGEDGCALRDITTRLKINVIMPRLVTADPEVRAHFDDYSRRLMLHETGHIDNAHRIAKEIDAALKALPPEPTCRAAKEKANALGHRIFDQGAARDVAYDAETDHGRIQGAHFP